MDSELLKLRIPGIVYLIALLLEVVVSILVVGAILISLWAVLLDLGLMASSGADVNSLHEFLATAFTVVIGIEFLKMLSRHNVSSCVEVLLFAIARQMVVEHTSPVENLLMVVAIAILFAIRKYLFIPGLDDKKYQPHHGIRAAEEKQPAHK